MNFKRDEHGRLVVDEQGRPLREDGKVWTPRDWPHTVCWAVAKDENTMLVLHGAPLGGVGTKVVEVAS